MGPWLSTTRYRAVLYGKASVTVRYTFTGEKRSSVEPCVVSSYVLEALLSVYFNVEVGTGISMLSSLACRRLCLFRALL